MKHIANIVRKKIFSSWSILFSISLLYSCSEDPLGQTPTDSSAPAQVTNVKVENIPSGAKITYTPPTDEDLLYVEARYTINGKQRNVKVSCFEDELTIQGYADMDEHGVELYSVDRSKNYSEPVKVSIKPMENPVFTISRSIEMERGVGGIGIKWKNESEAMVSLQMYAADSLGSMQLVEVLSTQTKIGAYALRGFDDQRRRFAVVVKDHWDNVSDTVSGYFTPRFEQIIPKDGYKRFLLPEDNNTELGGSWAWSKMFDGVAGVDGNGWHVRTNGSGHGVYFTIDLGHKVKLTRYKLWQRGGNWPYRQNNPRSWEMYGRVDDPEDIYNEHSQNDKDYWAQGFREDAANWTHLMHCITPKPSGYDNFEITSADIEYGNMGHEYEFGEDAPVVRYIRFTINETWGGGDLLNINELSFYGKIVDE